MQFGMPTLIECKTPEACAALCDALGLAFVELNMNFPEYQANRLDTEQLLRVAKEYGIYYTIHLDENCNPCDFNDRVAAAYTETVLQTIGAAKRLSAPILNMHLAEGIYLTLPGAKVFLFDEYKEEYLHRLAAFRSRCEAEIADSDIKICVENTAAFQRDFAGEALRALLKSPAFSLTFDIGHNAASGFLQQPLIYRHIDRLRHMHIHDAKGKANHLALGDGSLDLAEYIALARKHNSCAVLEVKTVAGLKQSVRWLKEMYL